MAIAAVLATLMAPPIGVQSGAVARAQDDVEKLSPEARERLYQELEDEVAALERHVRLLKQVVRLTRPAVVHIESRHGSSGGSASDRSSVEEAGSGVLIDHEGSTYVLTNYHVIKGSNNGNIRIKLWDGRWIEPKQVWFDSATDVAVMHVQGDDLVTARLGDSRRIDIGDFVLAVGSPFGLSHSVTYGIISAKGRRDLKLGESSVRFQDFLQTDAAINPGNSGGPLLNLRGQVVGINTAIASNSGGNEGIGFAIPINAAMLVASQLIESGRVTRAYLGVHLDVRFTEDMARRLGLPRQQGAYVTGVTPESPAEAAQIRTGDVILRFDGFPIDDDNHLITRVGLTPVGEKVDVVVWRDRTEHKVRVQVGDRSRFERER